MTNDELYQKCLDDITELFSDNSVSQSECRNNLNALIDEINFMIDTLEE
jgi:hypothetical protein